MTVRALTLIASLGLLPGVSCRPPADPVVTAWQARLTQEARLTDEELQRLRADVSRRVSGKPMQVRSGSEPARLPAEDEKGAVLEVLTLPAGVFDEGIRRSGGETWRVLNGPARSDSAEIEATQRLFIDARTLLPRRYEFSYAFPGYGADQALDILVEP